LVIVLALPVGPEIVTEAPATTDLEASTTVPPSSPLTLLWLCAKDRAGMEKMEMKKAGIKTYFHMVISSRV
jgi:hypothetical protein